MASVRVVFLGTGAGFSVHRAHTSIALSCDDGTRLLLDASSGNSALRSAVELGIDLSDYRTVLLSHSHGDHTWGLPFILLQRLLRDPDGAPTQVYGSEQTLAVVAEDYRSLSRIPTVDKEGVRDTEGKLVARWRPTRTGEWVDLGPATRAMFFEVDHIPGAVAWRVESSGVSIVFSGDTRYSPNLVEGAKGADLLIHEAASTEEGGAQIRQIGHSTGADAGRAAALAGVAELIITHIANPFHFDPQPLADEARQHFDGPISIAHDMLQVTLGGE